MSLRLRLRLYATTGGCGKMSRVCWSVDKMRKFSSRYRLMWALNGWYVMTRGTLSTFISPRSDQVRASGRPMVVTLRRSSSIEVSG